MDEQQSVAEPAGGCAGEEMGCTSTSMLDGGGQLLDLGLDGRTWLFQPGEVSGKLMVQAPIVFHILRCRRGDGGCGDAALGVSVPKRIVKETDEEARRVYRSVLKQMEATVEEIVGSVEEGVEEVVSEERRKQLDALNEEQVKMHPYGPNMYLAVRNAHFFQARMCIPGGFMDHRLIAYLSCLAYLVEFRARVGWDHREYGDGPTAGFAGGSSNREKRR